jgi:hypothetical protein
VHVRERRWLGLDAGVVARRRFSASSAKVGTPGTREERWSCAFADRVIEVGDGTGPQDRTLLEVRRSIDGGACRAPATDWGLTPRAGRRFYTFGPTEAAHEIADPRVVHEGLAVFRHEGVIVADGLDHTPLEYVLPLRVGVLWPERPAAELDADWGENSFRRVDGRVAEVVTPAGPFRDCWVIESRSRSWRPPNPSHGHQAASTADTAWVCDGVGEVRRRVELVDGSLRLTAETVLVELTRAPR